MHSKTVKLCKSEQNWCRIGTRTNTALTLDFDFQIYLKYL